MDRNLPGNLCREKLLFYIGAVERGEITPPVRGLIRGTVNGAECVIPLEIVTNVVPIMGANDKSPPAVEVRVLLSSKDPWSVKTGKDAKGRNTFLHLFDE